MSMTMPMSKQKEKEKLSNLTRRHRGGKQQQQQQQQPMFQHLLQNNNVNTNISITANPCYSNQNSKQGDVCSSSNMSSPNSPNKGDVVRIGLSFLLFTFGIYFNLTTSSTITSTNTITDTGTAAQSMQVMGRPSRSIHRVFQAVPTALPIGQHFENENDDNGSASSRRRNGRRNGTSPRTTQSSLDGIFATPRKEVDYETQYMQFSSEERRESLLSLGIGNACIPIPIPTSTHDKHDHNYNPVLEKYDDIGKWAQIQKLNENLNNNNNNIYKQLLAMQMELWKFCMIGSGYASTFVDYYGLNFLDSLDNVFGFDVNVDVNYVVVVGGLGTDHGEWESSGRYVTSAILSLGRTEAGKDVAKSIVQTIISTSIDILSNSRSTRWLSEELYTNIQKAADRYPQEFVLLESHCHGLTSTSTSHTNTGSCALDGQSPCCQVTHNQGTGEEDVVLLLMEHPMIDYYNLFNYDNSHRGGVDDGTGTSTSTVEDNDDVDESLVFMSTIDTIQPKQDIIISTNGGVVQKQNKAHNVKTQRTFDIFLENDCLPSYQCHVCLVWKRPDDADADARRSPCEACIFECQCYCQNICKIRPHDNYVAKEFILSPPQLRKDANYLIPRIIHQTYFEPITKEKYPNFSKLVSSWKHSGWEYNFYDDKASEEFLDKHFAPEVREAYDSILPGAYKADLFRICVLLIRGGIYSDVDVELTSDLDLLLQDDIGFVIPVDEPGRESGNGSCMWNGMIAAAPGHPFIAKSLEMIVNQIRNRFTAVDIDNMLCPGVALEHSHAWDLLFITGPCVIGAAINVVLGRSLQSEIIPGDLMTSQAEGEIPGRSIILSQNKNDMGWHRFTWLDKNIIVAGTDMPDYDDRSNQKHYSDKPQAIKTALFGTKNIYKDFISKNEDIKMTIRTD